MKYHFLILLIILHTCHVLQAMELTHSQEIIFEQLDPIITDSISLSPTPQKQESLAEKTRHTVIGCKRNLFPELHIDPQDGQMPDGEKTTSTPIPEKPKKFACTQCDKKFGQSSGLKDHQLLHQGVKPHECPHCPKKFTQLGNRNRHMRKTHPGINHILIKKIIIHAPTTTPKPFKCSFCDLGFMRQIALDLHMSKKHNQHPS